MNGFYEVLVLLSDWLLIITNFYQFHKGFGTLKLQNRVKKPSYGLLRHKIELGQILLS